MNIAASRNRDVIDFGAPFLVLFWRSKKEQPELKTAEKKKNSCIKKPRQKRGQ